MHPNAGAQLRAELALLPDLFHSSSNSVTRIHQTILLIPPYQLTLHKILLEIM
jgi:hypothetical protein